MEESGVHQAHRQFLQRTLFNAANRFTWQQRRKIAADTDRQQKSGLNAVCQVPGCTVKLGLEGKAYCLHRHICRQHLQADSIFCPHTGQRLRFCLQCGKLEPLSSFDGSKRSCRVALQKRRARHQSSHCQHINSSSGGGGSSGGGSGSSADGSNTAAASPTSNTAAAAAAAALGAFGTRGLVPMVIDTPAAAAAPAAASTPELLRALAARMEAAAAAQAQAQVPAAALLAASSPAASALLGLGHQLLPGNDVQLAEQQQQQELPRQIGQIQLVQQQQQSRSESSSPGLDLQCLEDDGVNPCVAACLSMAHELFPMLQLPELVVLLVALLAMKRVLPSS